MWLFLVFVGVPLIEIALFIQIGGWLTLWPTLAIVVLTAVLGTMLVRRQGGQVLRDAQRAIDELRDPLAPLAHGAFLLFAGALLLTPGFLTDAVGFALLVPAVRTAILRWAIRNRVHVQVFGASARRGAGPDRARPARDDIIEPEFRDVSPQPGARPGPAPDPEQIDLTRPGPPRGPQNRPPPNRRH